MWLVAVTSGAQHMQNLVADLVQHRSSRDKILDRGMGASGAECHQQPCCPRQLTCSISERRLRLSDQDGALLRNASNSGAVDACPPRRFGIQHVPYWRCQGSLYEGSSAKDYHWHGNKRINSCAGGGASRQQLTRCAQE